MTVTSVDTIGELKRLRQGPTVTEELVVVRGFDSPDDGCGGLYYWSPETPARDRTLDGVIMSSPDSGSWVRHADGPIHTRWVGIKPTRRPGEFDFDQIARVNSRRWNALNDFCKRPLLELLVPDKVNVVTNTIYLDPGIHDLVAGVSLGQGVGLDGAGPGRSVLRFDSNDGACVQVGTRGEFRDNHSLESAFDIVRNVSIVRFPGGSPGNEVGIAFHNTIRRCELANVHVQGFNVNVSLNAFGMDVRHCYFESAHTTNLRVGPEANSMMVVGCRIDGQGNDRSGENVLVDSAHSARSILFLRCDIQRSKRIALRAVGVASLAIRDCFFEGNNQADGSHPDIWIEGEAVRNLVIDGCYFTGTGRHGSTTSRAINIRGDVTASARMQISNNQQADSGTQGSFSYFLDVDANVPMKIFAYNNLQSAPNSIPPAAQTRGLTTVRIVDS